LSVVNEDKRVHATAEDSSVVGRQSQAKDGGAVTRWLVLAEVIKSLAADGPKANTLIDASRDQETSIFRKFHATDSVHVTNKIDIEVKLRYVFLFLLAIQITRVGRKSRVANSRVS